MGYYIDDEYKLHTQDAVGRTVVDAAVLTAQFAEKCRTYIEGYRYVPEGSTWTGLDGTEFSGPMLTPWRDTQSLEAAQGAYEDGKAAMQAQLDAQTARLDETQLALCDVYETLLAGEVT